MKPVIRPAFGYGRFTPAVRPTSIERVTRMPCLEPLQTADLRDYQVEGVQWLASKTFALLADEMRLGKTVQVLRALPRKASVIVVCPAIVQLVWRDEVMKWRPDLVPIVGPLEQPAQGEVMICSYDSLPNAPAGWQMRLLAAPLHETIVIFDECHFLKTSGALRTTRARKLARQVGRVWGLSGTPLLGTPLDLWGVLTSCRLDEQVAASREEFLRAFAADGSVAPGLRRKLKAVMLRRVRADVFDQVPKKTRTTVSVPAPDDLRNHLNELDARWLLLGVEDGELPPFELLSAARAALARSRIEAAKKFAKEILLDGEPLVVFSAHRDPVLAMASLPHSACIVAETKAEERADIVARFNDGKLDLVALTFDAGGVGIDLSRTALAKAKRGRSCNCILEIDLAWTPGVNGQGEARIESAEKLDPITIYQMVTDHPIDLRVLEILSRKEALIQETLRDA